ncbi:MAG: dolichyl-diphosphooligosaccharide--protein glycosyltransferase subunit 1 [Sclerophora amabilis]|nr:MAG: dolichyl-diphosphooligosaccharide--protein glycosyltransferase subunit 1 [Sclerophora amabilis]
MKGLATTVTLCSFLSTTVYALESNLTKPLSSRIILPSTFKPPQVFKNVNLLRNINLEKCYPRETINVVIENIDSKAQDEYFLPFEASLVDKVGGLEARDKNEPENGLFEAELVEYDPYSSTQFYRIRLQQPLKPSEQLTLNINFAILSALTPLPARIGQTDKQYLLHTFSAYFPSAYPTANQKTKLKFPGTEVPEYTEIGTSPETQGSTFTYGPFASIPAGASELVRVRYEFTKPVIHATSMERDIEISHWGGNLAIEERYWLSNLGAHLSHPFSRVSWATTAYYNPPTSAIRELRHPLRAGTLNPYFVDDIGNVSTSRFRSGPRDANVDLKPRYPVFGGWKYNFRVGWDANLKYFVRKVSGGDSYVLKVPFLEGIKMAEGVEYERVQVRVILPEGATNVKYDAPLPLVSAEISAHRTFMDTLGRTALKLTALNVFDDVREKDLIITYDYPISLLLRKPLSIFISLLGVFAAAWALGQVDISIGKKR